MAAKIISAIVLAVAVLASSAVAKHCEDEKGIEHFKPEYLCGVKFFIPYTSYKAQEIDCAFGKVTCPADGSVIFDTYVRRNGVINSTSTSTLQAWQGRTGVLKRTYSTSNDPIVMVVKSYSEYMPDDQGKILMKMAYILCQSNNDDILAKVVITNDITASVWDEKQYLLNTYEDGGIALIPNSCHPEEYFDN